MHNTVLITTHLNSHPGWYLSHFKTEEKLFFTVELSYIISDPGPALVYRNITSIVTFITQI